ncbi:MAG: ABC transporter ATP-binding protein [Nitrospinaceae bacterium]|nr:ABC transporter ATP-binding protein [Nitrospinaceae bacterium]MBT3432377.1 ABC transporter ATP-binding protein [Nitrospinaceae bacterium]MBT3822419.1 ABC transporter ATP-binding protein [Nitrospinaceae bacterium]MBT4094788.1 ABC transporter ATP-binding protein [Nitrospinaceae bacterium]MBT4429523.1 ABC transporter ATP-binding protein [Nitrospinaceae bacterium]
MAESQYALELKGVTKQFGGLTAVNDVTIRLEPGERRGILGPNGAGKTTLFHLITGVLPLTSGEVRMYGEDVSEWNTHRRVALGMARTFQITSLFPKLSVQDNVVLAVLGLRKIKMVMFKPLSSYPEIFEKTEKLLTEAGFWELRDTEVGNLSHGEQRQLEIVLALASDPKVILLDEPSAGLATGESREMATFLKSLDPNIAILIIEHDLDVIFEVASHISVLHYGELLTDGPADQIRNDPQVREIYLGQG